MSVYIHESSYIDDDVIIGEGSKIWYFCHIQSGARIGKNCSFGQNVNVGNNVSIGENVKVQNNVSIYEGVEIGNGVFLGPSCVFTNDLFPRVAFPKGRENYLSTKIMDGASIGANATILCGNTIGRNALIASGSVVTHDVPDHALVVGNPAKIAGWVCECGNLLDNTFHCVSCGKKITINVK